MTVLERPAWLPDWFEQTARRYFETHLLPWRHHEVRALQLGAFAGDASEWLLLHLPFCRLTDVDTWKGSPEHAGIDFDAVFDFYQQRLRLHESRLRYVRLPTRLFLANSEPWGYDFVYVDADHDPVAVLRDGLDAFERLRPGGLIAFDDYHWQPPDGGRGPAFGIDAFRYVMQERVELVADGAQVWLRRLA